MSKWYVPPPTNSSTGADAESEKVRIEAEVHRLVTARDKKYTNFIEYNNYKIIYRRYAGLFFTIAVDVQDNELSYLETIHLFVELLDAYFFQQFKKATGGKFVWLRATGSTVISQLFDSFIILTIVFYIGADPEHRWPWNQIAAIGLIGYLYKVVTAIVLTPLLYFVHLLIRQYLGHELAEKLKKSAISLE